jgi:predicted  nucleic acid-binding Zn-ribbon protein
MHSSVQQLLEVQRVDREIRFLSEARRLRPLELEADRKKLGLARGAVDSIAQEIRRLRLEVDRGELEIRQSDAEIQKLNVTLNTIKTNQEYTIVKEQIRRQEESRGKLEESVLEKLGELDKFEARRKELARELEEQERTYQRREAEVEEILKGLGEQIAALQKERGELTRGIDPQHLLLYERILEHHGDFAISQVRDFICQGCFMTVTTQQVNLLMLAQELVQCRNCSRLLYLG